MNSDYKVDREDLLKRAIFRKEKQHLIDKTKENKKRIQQEYHVDDQTFTENSKHTEQI